MFIIAIAMSLMLYCVSFLQFVLAVFLISFFIRLINANIIVEETVLYLCICICICNNHQLKGKHKHTPEDQIFLNLLSRFANFMMSINFHFSRMQEGSSKNTSCQKIKLCSSFLLLDFESIAKYLLSKIIKNNIGMPTSHFFALFYGNSCNCNSIPDSLGVLRNFLPKS